MNATIIKKAEKYVKQLLADQLGRNFLFHSQGYTNKQVKQVGKILDELSNSNVDKNRVLVATWFLNAGYTISYEHHVKESVELLTSF